VAGIGWAMKKLVPAFGLFASLFVISGTSVDAKTVGPPEVAWKDMTAKQKGSYMKAVVTPKMKPIFQAFDKKAFAKFNCETCHGKGAIDREFKMPGPDVKPLPSTPEAFQAKMKAEPTWPKFVDFMVKQVEPEMGKLLGLPVFDPKKPDPTAFACKNCHTLEGAAK
jgi:hypothetical protein